MMGDGFEELKVKMETGMQLALTRVDHMESLLWIERGKSKKYLDLLKELVEQDDLAVLLRDENEDAENNCNNNNLESKEVVRFEFLKK